MPLIHAPPTLQTMFHTPAEGGFCLFIYRLEMSSSYQEPSVRSASVLHALMLVKWKMKVVQTLNKTGV